ncbi:hypothetical protein LH128_07859 [Sphingomonas sp. LH128]|uniref:hypothetical protein n=1 Tax=Sphingomonas sp. LH128 TaxID=473781 RepID=UPI00027CC76E|nr:hypothetical protein [Sphingomonas sp. LH128]EJU13620.1 hypothetical protein LH128_07859 [Sphingomonas sp. LH128]
MSRDRDRVVVEWPGERKAPHSRRFSNELVEKARSVFQKRTSQKLTNEDARQMLENLTGFFRVLHEWDRAQAKGDVDPSRESGKSSRR